MRSSRPGVPRFALPLRMRHDRENTLERAQKIPERPGEVGDIHAAPLLRLAPRRAYLPSGPSSDRRDADPWATPNQTPRTDRWWIFTVGHERATGSDFVLYDA
jgi:hypothetical protein